MVVDTPTPVPEYMLHVFDKVITIPTMAPFASECLAWELTPFKETFEYAPTTVETLQAKPQVDYNKEVNRLLTMGMGGRKSGMLV